MPWRWVLGIKDRGWWEKLTSHSRVHTPRASGEGKARPLSLLTLSCSMLLYGRTAGSLGFVEQTCRERTTDAQVGSTDACVPGRVTARYFLRAQGQDRQQGDSETEVLLTNPSAVALAIPGAVNQCLRLGSNLARAPLTEPRTPLSLSLLP